MRDKPNKTSFANFQTRKYRKPMANLVQERKPSRKSENIMNEAQNLCYLQALNPKPCVSKERILDF